MDQWTLWPAGARFSRRVHGVPMHTRVAGVAAVRCRSPNPKGFSMMSGSRFRILLAVLGTILAAGTVRAQEPGAEGKSAGKWTDPPARAEPAPGSAAAPKPVAMPAKVDGSAASVRAESRPPRRSAKLRREQIRTVAARPRIERQARLRAPKLASQPERRVALRTPPRMAAYRPQVVRQMHGWRPVYGTIEPDAPAAAYYAQRRYGTAGVTPGELGVFHREGQAGGRLVMRWRGAAVPAGFVTGGPSIDGDEAE